MTIYRILFLSFICAGISGCDSKEKLFTDLPASKTNIEFKNFLEEDGEFNVLSYPYFYNGGGVAIIDVNNDGLQDILFTGNMVKNRLYLNKGDMEFEDITDASHVAEKQGWCTGVAIADVNTDGWLDIYICRSADAAAAKRKNLLFINNHDNTFSEQADKYGIADEGYSTHAAFFDYDRDNDLDLVVINHSLKEFMQGQQEKPGIRNQKSKNFGTHLYRNDNGRYANVSDSAGVTSNVLSFGLGVAVSDLNNDGWPDMYISNDFNEGDYCFINQKNGTFREMGAEMFDYTSLFSMGNAAADINNDGMQDIVTLDMLPETNYLQKMHNGSENFDKFQLLFRNGFSQQYSRNMLQVNRGNGTFTEAGQFAGISNTDWSWAPLAADYDEDGKKDLFISNGYVKDYTDMDYIKYNVDIILEKNPEKQREMMSKRLDKIPTIKISNYMFRNNGNMNFKNLSSSWGLDEPRISAGAAYADLDNDGDLDLAISNCNEPASIYRNNLHDNFPGKNYIGFSLVGDGQNPFAIGSKITLVTTSGIQVQEMMPSRGFQSSVDYRIHFGVDSNVTVKEAIIHWPTGKVSTVKAPALNKIHKIAIAEAANGNDNTAEDSTTLFSFRDTLAFRHRENVFNDFNEQVLLPQWFSRQGPCDGSG